MASAEKTTSPLHVWNSVLRSSKEIIVSNINVIMITFFVVAAPICAPMVSARVMSPDT